MPSISYRDLLAGEATTEITYNGHTISLTYDPATITDNMFREMRDMGSQAMAIDGTPNVVDAESDQRAQVAQAFSMLDSLIDLGSMTNALICRILIRWDLTDADGVSMYPLTDARLGDLPLDFRQAVLQAAMAGGRMGEANGTTSPAPSRAITRTATRAGSRR